MLTISTIPEALAELERRTGRAWTDSELFDLAANCSIELHAAPPITARTTIQKFVIGEGLVEKFRSGPGHARLAVLFPWQVGQLWISGETMAVHTEKHNEIEDEYQFFTEGVRVTREQVRIKDATLQKILAVWNQAQAGRWLENDKKPGDMRYQTGPDWMFPIVPQQPAPAQSPAKPAPVAVGALAEPAKAGPLPLTTGDIAFCFAGLRWKTETEWKKPLGDKPKWLAACIVIPGVRGVSETRWSPVCIGAALVRDGHAKPNSVRAKFQTQPLLTPWLDEWKTYEADNSDSN